MSVFATVTLVVTPFAIVCLAGGLYWWFRQRLAGVEAERDQAAAVRDRHADGLHQVIDLIDWGQPEQARIVAERALQVSTYAGDLWAARVALKLLADEYARFKEQLSEGGAA